MRIGILGGTFDPVHKGHLYLAKKALKKLSLNRIIFIPTNLPPHKKSFKVAPARHRYNMLKLAIGSDKNFKLSDIEIKRKGRSYSVDTMKVLRKKYEKPIELFFITGSDSLKELRRWKNLKEFSRLCKFIVVKRPGFKMEDIPRRFVMLDINAEDISSTDIRRRIKNLRSIDKMVPGKVKGYIKRHKLYT